ncbi:MAG: polyribonucleotide nucleotidyltransferase [Candidatus Sericytochromatia bacterium]|nr:polyribonucleotide nucleotidyltransferase [Candidatus Sericytochromatia bacterium]
MKTFTYTLGGREIKMTFGKYAKQASGAVLVESGETAVLVTATMSKSPREGIDFFPLLVDYEEKHYSVGRIPGSFHRREGRAGEHAILSGRLIDRSIRPLFPDGFRNDVQVVAYTLSCDQQVEPDMLAMVGASAALTVSEIPFDGPCCGVRVGRVNGQWLVNPTFQETEEGDFDLVVAGTAHAIMMVEAGIRIVPEDQVLEAIDVGFQAVQELVAWQQEIARMIGKAKVQPNLVALPAALVEWVGTFHGQLSAAIQNPDKKARDAATDAVMAEVKTQFAAMAEDHPVKAAVAGRGKALGEALYELEAGIVRSLVLDKGLRVDGRRTTEIRKVTSEVSVLPRTHGTGLFTRGQTQVLNICTLGSMGDAQKIDGLDPITSKRYLHHYNFPGFSVGEVKPSRGAGRREIGHGALAERALVPVLPGVDEFPYAIRLVSEVLESNGSTSMASTCGSTLSLMDAGVPIKAPVAGIAMGLIKEDERFAVLTDIQGIEDHLGDMDFKVTGTREGVTALQMDIKIAGISLEIMQQALEQARVARLSILDVMEGAIAKPRTDLSPYAPRILTLKINPEKIGALIGPGGKMIKRITEETGVKIDVEDDGTVYLTTSDAQAADAAMRWVQGIAAEAEVGRLYTGKVTRILNFGAFVEILPGKEGLVHISQLAPERVAKVEDVVNIGDIISVKCTEIDSQGRINLSRKAVLAEELAVSGK